MQGFPGILFQMRPGDADHLAAAILQFDAQLTLADDRQFELTDLVTLRQIGIEIVFARKYRALAYLCIDRQAKLKRHVDRFLVEHRQHPRKPQVHDAGLGVGLGAVGSRRGGENFRFGGQLSMNLKPDDDFPLHVKCP